MAALAAILAGCANIKAPSGGPDDKTPPEISACSPQQMARNFNDFPIVFEFSEYVDKSTVTDNIRINPDARLKFSWKGRKLRITPAQPLAKNTTYCISADPGYKDMSGNIPQKGFSLIFSTGNEIDSCAIAGKVLEKADGYSVFCYALDGINPDTLDPRHTKPLSKVKIGSSGRFAISALKAGSYRLFLVNDLNSDGLYNEGTEAAASASKDIHLRKNGDTDWLTFASAKIRDIVSPEIDKLLVSDSRTIKLKFTEPLTASGINAGKFTVSDSSGRKIPILAAYRSEKDSASIFIITSEKMSKTGLYKLTVTGSDICDSVGNAVKINTASDEFHGSDDEKAIDEINIKQEFSEKLNAAGFDRKIVLTFSEPLKSMPEIISAALQNKKSGHSKEIVFKDSLDDDILQIPAEIKFVNQNRIFIELKKSIEDFTEYTFTLKLKKIVPITAPEISDTVLKTDFTTADTRFYGSLSGSLRDSLGETKFSDMLVLAIAENGLRYTSRAAADGSWSFSQLPPDNYSLHVFCDSNGNGRFDCGNIKPFAAGEKYFLTERKVVIPKRWKVEDVILDISGAGK